jgi:hypothetical protein
MKSQNFNLGDFDTKFIERNPGLFDYIDRQPEPLRLAKLIADISAKGYNEYVSLGEYRGIHDKRLGKSNVVLPDFSHEDYNYRSPYPRGDRDAALDFVRDTDYVHFTDTTPRDQTQSNSGNRFRLAEDRLIAPYLDKCNFFSIENGILVKKGEYKGPHYEAFKAVDVADVNQNLRAEIFVTGVDRKSNVRSSVLEWNNGSFQTVVKDSTMYYRVLKVNGENRLYGQDGGYSEPFSGKVYNLSWDGAGYGKDEAVALPPGVNIFSFVQGDLLGTGSVDNQTLWADQDGVISLTTSTDKAEWTSTESYGSTPLFIVTGADEDFDDQQRVYINSRMGMADLDGNGHSEAIVVHNRDRSRGLLDRFRSFSAGSILALSWNSAGVRTLWETEQVKGCIADWALEDLDNDGRPELIYCVNLGGGTLLSKKRSNVVVEKIE